MARFEMQLPTEIMKDIQKIYDNSEQIFGEMTKAGAEVAMQNIIAYVPASFKNSNIMSCLKLTRTYKTPTDDGINTKVGFYGYDDDGVAIPLKALAREYGTSRGEKKKPFMRKAFKDTSGITNAMLKVQERYIK